VEKMTEIKLVPADEKKFIGIGKIVFNNDAEWNIPHLHFMVDETTSGNYEATLLEFGLVSWSESKDEAIKSLILQTQSHIINVMEKAGFDEFIMAVDNHLMDGYWKQYRKIEFTLARSGRDLSHELESRITKAIQDFFNDKIKEIITSMAKIAVDEAIKEYEKMAAIKLNYVRYSGLEAAA
jgi:hypothetical protein